MVEADIDQIRNCAMVIHDAVIDGHRLFVFGCNHASLIAGEACSRAGCLVLWNAIHPPGLTMDIRPRGYADFMEHVEQYGELIAAQEELASGDVLVIVSNSGRNQVPTQLALAAKSRGVTVIAITSLEHSAAVSSLHSSGKKLFEVSDFVLDNHAPLGDAVMDVDGTGLKLGAVSTLTGVYIIHALDAEIVDRMVKGGVEVLPVRKSRNTGGDADEHNALVQERYRDWVKYRVG